MKTDSTMRAFALFVGAAVLSTSAKAVVQDSNVVTRTQVVKYSPSTAITSEGATLLYKKLYLAADKVCGDISMGDLATEGHRACVSAALEKAVQDIGIPMIQEMHARSRSSVRR